MDTRLQNGDHAVDARGIPYPVEGADELIQRALIRLSVPKGSFVYDPALGSELYRLNTATPDAQRKALAYVQEALLPLPQFVVESVTLERSSADLLHLGVALRLAEKRYQLEVAIV
jgi:hypothetical protein